MRLVEFEGEDPLRVKLVAILKQIRGRLDDSGGKLPIKVDSLLKILNKAGLSIDKSTLLDMITKTPVKNIISNIKGDDVIFNNSTVDTVDRPDKDENEETLHKMANRALDTKR